MDLGIANILLKYSEYFTKSDFILYGFRIVGWFFIKGLSFLVNKLEDGVDSVTKVTDFFNSPEITALINKFKPLLGLLLVASIIFIGYQLMINKKFDRSRVPMNIILALCIVVAMPLAMDKLNTLSNKVIGEIQGDVHFADQIIENNITDLYLLDEANFPIKDDGTVGDINPKNNLGNNNIKINPNEEIDRSKVNNKKVFENEVIFDSVGNPTLNRIVGLFKWDDEYYRFHINFFTIIVTLLITAFVMLFTAIKMIKLSIELAFSKVMTTFVAVADLSGGQRIRQSINGIMSIFIAMISTMLMLKLYILGTAYLSDKISGIGTVLAMIGCAIFVIDGPNYIEKMFGVDAGLSSVWRTITGINSALDILGKLGNATSEMAKNLGEGILGGLSFAKGMADEAMNSSLEDQMENAKKKDGDNKGDSLENQMKNKGFNNDDSPIVDVDFEEVDDSKENEVDSGLDENVDSSNTEHGNETLNSNNGEDEGNSNQSTLEDEMNSNNSVDKQDDNNVSGNQELSNNSDNSSSESSNQTLEDDINEANNNSINGNETLGDTNNSIDDGSSSLESEIENSNLNSETLGMNNLDTESLGIDDGGIESQLNSENSISDSIEDNLKNGDIGNESLDNNSIDSNSSLGNEDISNQEKIDDKVDEKAKEEVEMNNPNIGYENPVENRNIYDVLKGKLTGNETLNDTRIKLGRSYEIGKNTTRDINKFINKKKKGDKK
ncbi:pLS20_p028 family conjugation system transmembrane protein [Clostridium perfringens]|uniref:pLS20_p028 family conjugation system transmembrane protein n=1 Tax=Clostridium perfringens TaxID=1502 RepID=UPI0039E87547